MADRRILGGMDEIPAERWDALVPAGEPFMRHGFLALMEASGSATRRTGWQPLHLTLEAGGELAAAAPLYLKSHSWGEYVFDHGWAEALERAGGSYYPKLQLSVPFTPVPGPRLLARSDEDRQALATALQGLAEELRISSAHVTFCTEQETLILEAAGFLVRHGIQYHWHNRGYRDFADFLDTLRSDKRKMIRKERAAIEKAGVQVETLVGEAAKEALAEFFPFYQATVDKRWGSAYLTRRFFQGLATELSEGVVLVRASKDGRMVGGALNLRGGDALYGRLWGALEEYRFLHFECCYYRAIDHAIGNGLERVEAGAQGTHKLLRGYAPVWTHSAHWLADPGFREAVARFLRSETARLRAELPGLEAALPYRSEPGAVRVAGER